MDYDNPQFIAAVKKILRDGLTQLTNSLNDLKDAVSAQWQADEKRYETKPVSVTDLRTDIPIRVQTETKRSTPESAWRYIIGTLEAAAFLAIIVYAIFSYNQWQEMITANEISMANFRRSRIDANGQLKQSMGQTELARNNFITDQRAWIGLLGSNHVFVELVKGAPIKASVDIANFGRTPALNEASLNDLINHPIDKPMPAFRSCDKRPRLAGVTLMPNASANVTMTTDTPGAAGFPIILSDADIEAIGHSKVQLLISGCIWYDDVFGNTHRTEYCLEYIPRTKGLGACSQHNSAN